MKAKHAKALVKRSKPVAKPSKAVAKPSKPQKVKPLTKAQRTADRDETHAVIAKQALKSSALVKHESVPTKHESAKYESAKHEDAPRIETRLIVGELSVPVDPSNLERTLGAGRWGHGLGLVDQWPDAAWVGLLVHLGLKADPLDRTAAEMPIKRLVQQLWYEAVQPWTLTDKKELWAKRDADAATTYATEHVEAVEEHKAKAQRAKTSFHKSGETAYTPAAAIKAKGFSVGGQQVPLLAAFKTAKWAAMTTVEAAAAMVTAGLKTSTKPERIAAFYLCQWVKKGWLTKEMRETA